MAVTRLMQKTVAVKSYSSGTYYPPSTSISAVLNQQTNKYDSNYLFIDFGDIPPSIALHAVSRATLNIYLSVYKSGSNQYPSAYLHAFPLNAPIVLSSGFQGAYTSLGFLYYKNIADLPTGYITLSSDDEGSYPIALQLLLKYGLQLQIYSRIYSNLSQSFLYSWSLYANNDHPVYIDIETGDDIVSGSPDKLYPASGFINEKVSQRFSWDIKPSFTGYVGELKQASAQFQWRCKGSETVTSYECGEEMSCTVPANTFPTTGAVEWRVQMTDNGGHTSTSEWVSFYTTEAISSASALSPVNGIVDGSTATEFKWQHKISTGTKSTGADLEYSMDGEVYIRLANTDDDRLSCVVPPDTFPGGNILWRVRTYNTDGLPGAWSAAARFVSIAAPPAPVLRVDASPRPLISWQSSEQQAWQLEIPGVLSLPPKYGYDYSYMLSQLLNDGHYEAKVRIQSSLGMWSEWASIEFDVENRPGAVIQLIANQTGCEAELVWDTAGTFDRYLIYRDGELVGKTDGNRYTDSFSTGEVEYFIRGLADGNNYSQSNSVTVNIEIETAAICTVDDRDWLPLIYSQKYTTTQELSYSKPVEYLNVTGAKLPMPEVSEYETQNVNIDFAFTDVDCVKKVNAMRGKLVCLKLRRGVTYFGVLSNVTQEQTDFFDTFEISMRRTHFEEVISIEDN